MRRYAPGQSVRMSLVSTSLGIFADPPTPTLTVHFPDGSSVTPTIVHDSIGNWHADVLIASTMMSGIAWYQWVSTGAQVDQNAASLPKFFEIVALPVSA